VSAIAARQSYFAQPLSSAAQLSKLTKRLGERGTPPQLRRGGRDIKKKTAQPPLMERTGWSGQEIWINTTPSARIRRLRSFSFIAQPPLLS
jgi:hypothetical protein